jgi:hypothetical protein
MSVYKVIYEDGTEDIIEAENYAEVSKEVCLLQTERVNSAQVKEVWVKCGKVGL